MDLLFIPLSSSITRVGKNHGGSCHDSETITIIEREYLESIQNIAKKIRNDTNTQADVFFQEENASLYSSESKITVVSLFGPMKNLTTAKLRLTSCGKMYSITFNAGAYSFFDVNCQPKPSVFSAIEKIETATKTNIRINIKDISCLTGVIAQTDFPNSAIIEIIGSFDSVQLARFAVLEMLQKTFEKCSSHKIITIETKSLPFIIGRKSSNIRNIMNETFTSIYYPILFDFNGRIEKNANILICGESSGVENAAKMISDLIEAKAKKAITRSYNLPNAKCFYLINQKHEELLKIVLDYGVYLDFIYDKNGNNASIRLTAEYSQCLEQAMKAIISLTTLCFQFDFILTKNLVSELSSLNIARGQFTKRFSSISKQSKVEIAIHGNLLSCTGESKSVINAARLIWEIEEIRNIVSEFHVYTDMDSSYHEFITGKKNGKINKINKSCGVLLKLSEPMPHILQIQILARSFESAIEAFSQLKDELPAEHEFHVADIHHKRIIGAGGKNIQAIMKMYGAYVKFVSSDEFKSIGGLKENENNVIARTPAKNSNNLINLYNSIMELVESESGRKQNMVLTISRKYFHKCREILSKKEDIKEFKNIEFTISDPFNGEQTMVLSGMNIVIDRALEFMKSKIPVHFLIRLSAMDGKENLFGQFRIELETLCKDLQYQVNFDKKNLEFELSGNERTSSRIKSAVEGLIRKTKELPILQGSSENQTYIQKRNNNRDRHELESIIPAKMTQSNFNFRPRSASVIESKSLPGSVLNLQLMELEMKRNQMPVSNIIGPKHSRNSDAASETSEMKAAVQQITTGSTSIGSFLTIKTFDKNENTILFGPKTSIPISIAESPMDQSKQQPPGLKIMTNKSIFQSASQPDAVPSQSLVSSVMKNVLVAESDNRLDLLLDSLDLAKFKKTFAENDVDFEMFLNLTEEDFKELGLTLGARKRLIIAINELKASRIINSNSITSHFTSSGRISPTSPAAWALSHGNGGDWTNSIKSSLSTSATTFTPYSARSTLNTNGQSSGTSNQVPIRTITSPLSPTKNMGFVDFVPGVSPLASPIYTKTAYSQPTSPTKTKGAVFDVKTISPPSSKVSNGFKNNN